MKRPSHKPLLWLCRPLQSVAPGWQLASSPGERPLRPSRSRIRWAEETLLVAASTAAASGQTSPTDTVHWNCPAMAQRSTWAENTKQETKAIAVRSSNRAHLYAHYL